MIRPEAEKTGREMLLEALAKDAEEDAPRLFALYEVREDDDDCYGTVGWGIDFRDERGALFGWPECSSTWHSESAERLLQLHQAIGDAHLRWLTP